MKKSLRLYYFCFLILFPSLVNSQNYIGDENEVNIILANIQKFSKSVMASDYQEIGNAYTLDAKIFPSNRDIIHGREAIIKYWTLPDGRKTKYHKVIPEEIKITGDEAYDFGYYEGITINSNGQESAWKGKYVIVWKKIDEDWKIYLDIWNIIRD